MDKTKQLSDLSLEELWQLFPIFLKPHNPAYYIWYEEAKQELIHVLGLSTIARINHFGSSAIKNLDAKPIVDILL